MGEQTLLDWGKNPVSNYLHLFQAGVPAVGIFFLAVQGVN
jgi:hypothetical protein